MKKILLIALVLAPFWGISQTTKPIDGVLGIKFGSSKEEVIAAVKAKGGILDEAHSNDARLFFDNVKLGSKLSETFQVELLDKKVFSESLIFKVENDIEIFDNYKSLVNDISGVYGQGNSVSNFKSPYKNDDPDIDKVVGIKEGYATIYTNWLNDKKRITVYITNKLQLVISYEDDVAMAEYRARKKAKESSDY